MRSFNLFIITVILFFGTVTLKADSTEVMGWKEFGQGFNYDVNTVTLYRGRVVAAGGFRNSGQIPLNYIAEWNGSEWIPLGAGFNDTVYTLTQFGNDLIAGGSFTMSGSVNVKYIARWNGGAPSPQWSPLYTGNSVNGEVKTMTVFKGNLIMGGEFDKAGGLPVNNICGFDGIHWFALGTGTDDDVFALTVYGNDLIAAGRFEEAGGVYANNIARWNSAQGWRSMGSGLSDRVHAVTVYNNKVVAGGRFPGYISEWNGTTWTILGGGVEDRVYALASSKSELYVGGQFKFVGSGNQINANRIAKWNGYSWSALGTGMSSKVNAIYADCNSTDTAIIVGGEFITAGGRPSNKIASWTKNPTSVISGNVRFNDNNQNITAGYVKAYYLDLNTKEVITIDSASVAADGSYVLNRVRKDRLYVIAFPGDVKGDDRFVPTYHPSAIDWQNAALVDAINNVVNVNIKVLRSIPEVEDFGNGSVTGKAILSYLPPGYTNGTGLSFKAGTIVYAKQGDTFRSFSLSNTNENYLVESLAPGNYEIYFNRLGYSSTSLTVTVNNNTVTGVDATLNPQNPVGIQQTSTEIPEGYVLKQNYPNPFNPVTQINYSIPQSGLVKLAVYDLVGREIAVLVNGNQNAGSYTFTFNASGISTGVYFYRLDAEGFTQTKKMMLIK